MDTVMPKLPSEVGTNLRENIAVIGIVSMFSIGAYNALETVFITFDIVKNHRSLYFWSMQIASWGILVYALPAMACFLSHAPNLPMSIPLLIGWYAMVTGQSVVLYSRLHLVVLDVSQQGAMGAMDDHRQRVHSACPNDGSLARPQQWQCTFRSPCRN